MNIWRRLIMAIMLGWALLLPPALYAQELITATSDRTIEISSNFSGQTITIFGAISAPSTQPELGPVLGVKMLLLGPDEAVEVRKKTKIAGIWVNGEKKRFDRTPSFAALLTSKALNRDIYDSAQTELFGKLAPPIGRVQTTKEDDFRDELIRLRRAQNHVQIKTGAVELLSPSIFTARIELPTTIASGTYLIITEIYANESYLATSIERFDVKKSGIERFIFDASNQMPFIYGLATILLALVTGWLGSIIFRRG